LSWFGIEKWTCFSSTMSWYKMNLGIMFHMQVTYPLKLGKMDVIFILVVASIYTYYTIKICNLCCNQPPTPFPFELCLDVPLGTSNTGMHWMYPHKKFIFWSMNINLCALVVATSIIKLAIYLVMCKKPSKNNQTITLKMFVPFLYIKNLWCSKHDIIY
jgi:hypothetical protein